MPRYTGRTMVPQKLSLVPGPTEAQLRLIVSMEDESKYYLFNVCTICPRLVLHNKHCSRGGSRDLERRGHFRSVSAEKNFQRLRPFLIRNAHFNRKNKPGCSEG